MRYEIGQVLLCGDDCEETIEAGKEYIARNNLQRHEAKITRRTDRYGTYVCVVATMPIGVKE